MNAYLLMVAALFAAEPNAAMTQDTGHVAGSVILEYSLNYLISLPEDYDPSGPPLPLLVFLHGAGERSENIDLVKKHGPPKMIANGHQFRAIVVSPQCMPGTWWEPYVPGLIAMLDKVESEYHIDKDRVYLTGLSMGAYGTFTLAAAQPDRFAALLPISGGGTRTEARALTKTPIWMFHGDADPIIEVEESQRMLKFLNARNGENAKLTIYPGVEHNAWTQTYDNPEVWQWLFSQKRGATKTATPAP